MKTNIQRTLTENIIEMSDICKSFKEVNALDSVSFCIQKGEIRAVIGENGAGKSTLMNVLYGMIDCDDGLIKIKGEPIQKAWTPSKAISHGIGMIHQHFSSIPSYTVLENVMLPALRWGMIHNKWREEAHKIERIVEEYQFSVSLADRFGDIPIGQKQQVEIIKVLYQGIDILILDEPTSVLTPQQADALLALLGRLRDDGISIVIVTHKLEEAMQICDSITVLRRGCHVATVQKNETTIHELARLMIDRDYQMETEAPVSLENRQPIMEIDDLSIDGGEISVGLAGVSLTLNEGEILGVAGVAGNGQNELAETIVGLRQVEEGSIHLEGEDIVKLSIGDRLAKGIGYIPEDRHNMGLVLPLNIADNLVLSRIDAAKFSKKGFLNNKNIRSFACETIQEFNIKTPDEKALAEQLSGGNQQKVVLGRVLKSDPKMIVANQPTWGLDFGATEYIRARLKEIAEEGAGILLISNDLDEILELSNRIIVMYKGRIVGEMTREDVDLDALGMMMIGKNDKMATAI